MTLLSLLSALVSEAAHAQIISEAVRTVTGGQIAGDLAAGTGGTLLNALVVRVVTAIMTLVTIAALFIFVRAGIKLINSEEEDKLSKAKKTMASSIVAVVLAYLGPSLVGAFYGTSEQVGLEGGTVLETPGGVAVGAALLSEELLGIMRWATVLVAPLAILIIVVGALRAVASFGKDDAVAQLRRAVFGVIGGIVILTSTEAIKAVFGLSTGFPPGIPSTAPILLRGIFIVNALLLYLALGAAVMVVYAGMLMILNYGNDDQYTKAKGLLIRVALGLSVVFVSYVLVQFIIGIMAP